MVPKPRWTNAVPGKPEDEQQEQEEQEQDEQQEQDTPLQEWPETEMKPEVSRNGQRQNEARSICTQLQPARMKREREECRKRTRTIKEHQELEIEEYLREK